MQSKLAKLLVVAIFSCATGAVVAHHSAQVYFDSEMSMTLENAVVVSLVLVNPHSRLVFTVEGVDGEFVEWTAETQSYNSLRRKGIGRDLVSAGDVVTVIGNPSRSGKPYLRMRQLILPNGDTVNFYGGGPAITPAGS